MKKIKFLFNSYLKNDAHDCHRMTNAQKRFGEPGNNVTYIKKILSNKYNVRIVYRTEQILPDELLLALHAGDLFKLYFP